MTEKNKGKNNKISLVILIILLLLTLGTAVVLVMAINGKFDVKEEIKTLTSSALMDTIDIAELSASEFRFNGIATIYNKKKTTKVDCQIKYEAIVKASIDMKEVIVDLDDSNKIAYIELPKITIKPMIITKEDSFDFMPNDVTYGIEEITEICKKDAEEEAVKSNRLIEIAEENLKDTIKALLIPILDEFDYEIVWGIKPIESEVSNEVEVVTNETP